MTSNDSSPAANFWRDGFAVLDNFIDDELTDACEAAIRPRCRLSPEFTETTERRRQTQTETVGWFPLQEGVEAFRRLNDDPRLAAVTTELLGAGWEDIVCMVSFSHPGSAGQSWHQDCPPENDDQFNLNRLIYTDDVDPANGGQVVVMPGSHRMGELPTGAPCETMAGQVVLAPKKGTLVLLHGQAWHRVLAVTGSRWRTSTNYRVVPKGVPHDVTDVGVYRNVRYRFSTTEVLEER